MAEEKQRIIFGRDTSMSSGEVSVRRQNLPRMDRHGRRRCSQCSCLIGHWYWQSQGTTVPGLFVYVCISPLQGYFPVSCGAVLPQECGHSTITLALAGFLLLFLNFSVPTSKTDMLTMCYSLAHSLQVGRDTSCREGCPQSASGSCGC